jgi:hypothetical protein
MLYLLVDFLSGIIRILAAACVIGGATIGYMMAPDLQVEPWVGALIGFSAGFLVASLGGGLIACLILIENHLRVLAEAQAVRARHPAKQEVSREKPEETPPPPAAAPPAYEPYRSQYRYQPPVQPTADTDKAETAAGKQEKPDK